MSLPRREHAAEQRAEQDREERAHLEQRVAADQLRVAQHLRQQAVLRRREERRMHAHQEQRAEQHRMLCVASPTPAIAMMRISLALTIWMTRDLS